jgi:hypothetical protein
VLSAPTHSSDSGYIGVDAKSECCCNFERGTRRQAATDWHSGGHCAGETARCHVAFIHGSRHASDVATPSKLLLVAETSSLRSNKIVVWRSMAMGNTKPPV